MKLKTGATYALLILSGSFGAALSAGAAIVTQPVANDIFLGVRAAGGTGASTALLVNLGQYSTFSGAAPGSTFSLNIGNIGTDLTSIYGAGWETRTDLYWGIVGSRQGVTPVVYASRDSSSSPWLPSPQEDLDAASSAILSFQYATNGYTGKESTANSPVAVAQTGASGAGSWIQQVSGQPLDFGTWSNIETSVGGNADLSLYRISSTAVTSPGSFALGPGGTLTFTAVPEPSVVLGALSGFLVLTFCRHRRPAVL